MALPELDPEQRRKALEKAAFARRVRAELKQMLKTGEVTLRDVLDRADDVEPIAKMRVSEVIESMPSYGKVRARELMERLNIAASRRVRGLGINQRSALLAAFGESDLR
ncbi:MAG: integration host factor [Actinobacteria bacterium]|nr:integration host factor [Actinomycetota bacterium]